MKIFSVIARYNEDLSWVQNLNTDVIIYNKGEDTDIPHIKIENYGRESETFIRFILDWYEKIQEYDSVAFLQGNPFDHIQKPLDLIHNASPNKLIALSKYSSKINLNKNNQLKTLNDYALSRILGYDCEIDTSYLSPKYDKFTKNMETNYASMILELCGIMRISNIDCTWAPGAQYIVPTYFILNKKFDWWLDLHTLHKIYEDNLKDKKSLPHILERIWPAIWLHSTK